MRALLVAAATLLALVPLSAAQASVQTTMDVTVGADRAETMRLTFEGLRRLTTYQGICLPEGARESRVYDELGDVQYEAKEGEDGRRVVSFLARSEKVAIDLARPGPDANEHPLYASDLNFCVPAGSTTRVNVRVPEDHTLFFLSDGGRIENNVGTLTREGPLHVFFTYEAPLEGRLLVAFEEGPFRVFAAPSFEPQAREVARLARAPFEAAAKEAALPMPFDKLRVLYSRETAYSWEAGHYNGQGFVTVKEATLREDPAEGYPYTPVKVLVHEGFHALSFPFGKGRVEDSVAWWLEGSARRAERQVDLALPNATRRCETQGAQVRCWSFDDRIKRAELERAYAPGFAFDTRWEPGLEQSESTRKLYYGLSEVVVSVWIERHGVEAYRAAWREMLAAFDADKGCPCEEGWLLGVLDEAAGGRDEDLFAPHATLRASNPQAFAARMEPYVQDEAALERELQARTAAKLPVPGLGVLWLLLALALLARR